MRTHSWDAISTLTNRTDIWHAVESLQGNQLVGTGFMSFWSPERLAAFQNIFGDVVIQQAHNGYLEQQANLGYVGVAFVLAIMAFALKDVRRHLDRDPAPALLRLCFLVTAALYNYTEASFYGINNMWGSPLDWLHQDNSIGRNVLERGSKATTTISRHKIAAVAAEEPCTRLKFESERPRFQELPRDRCPAKSAEKTSGYHHRPGSVAATCKCPRTEVLIERPILFSSHRDWAVGRSARRV